MSEVCSVCGRTIDDPLEAFGSFESVLCRECWWRAAQLPRLMRASEGMEAEGWNLEVTADWTPEEIEAEARNGGDDE